MNEKVFTEGVYGNYVLIMEAIDEKLTEVVCYDTVLAMGVNDEICAEKVDERAIGTLAVVPAGGQGGAVTMLQCNMC